MLAPGIVLGSRYRIESHVGGGNMGDVYAARHTATGRQLAVKVLRTQLLRNDLARDKFAAEVQVGAVIGESHHIVEVSDAGFDPDIGVPFLVMPLLRGEALDAILSRGPMEPGLAVRLMKHLARALDQAHKANVVHRDIKPSNLFVVLDHEGLPLLKVLDFGIAKVVSSQGDMTATELGTPAYRAPEQLSAMFKQLARQNGVNVAAGVSSATDVWAVALVVYECLTGYGPGQVWAVQSVQELGLRILAAPPVASVAAGPRASLLPAGFDAWFAWCIQRDASRRCQRVSEAVTALERLFDTHRASAAIPKSPPITGTSIGNAVATYAPAAHVVVEVARVPTLTPPAAKQTSLVGAVNSYVPLGPPPVTAVTTGGAAASERSVAPATTRIRKWIAIAAGGGSFIAVAVVLVSLTRATRAPPSVASAQPVDSTPAPSASSPVESAVQTGQLDAERQRVGASVRIPEGSFRLGSDHGERDERPTQQVTLPAFELDVDEVTVQRFAACVKAGACDMQYTGFGNAVGKGELAQYWSSHCNWGIEGREQHPMNCVDWPQAEGFCAWVGKRLPTETEWEYAAGLGEKESLFPWGADEPTAQHANACGPECTGPLNELYDKAEKRKRLIPVFELPDGHEGTAAVGSFAKGTSPLGLRDLAGNVWEWTATPYCSYGTTKCLKEMAARGGGWDTPKGKPSWLRATFRNYFAPDTRAPFLGFRCARKIN